MARNRTAKDQQPSNENGTPENDPVEAGNIQDEGEAPDESEDVDEPPVLGAGLMGDSAPTPVAPPLTPAERLAILERKVEMIGHGLYAKVTHASGHLLDDFVEEWGKFSPSSDIGGQNESKG